VTKRIFLLFLVVAVLALALVAGLYVGKRTTNKVPDSSEEKNEPVQTWGEVEILPGGRDFVDLEFFQLFRSSSVLSSLTHDADIPQVTEMVWQFDLDGKDYSFRTLGVPCEFQRVNDGNYSKLGAGLDKLTTGKTYRLMFAGLESPLKRSMLDKLDKYNDLLPGCREVWGSLRADSQDPERLRRFFTSGQIEGFEIDENGVLDLRKIITLIEWRSLND